MPGLGPSRVILSILFNGINASYEWRFSFQSLKRLNLAGNRLVHLEDSNFASLIHLTHLDLSHNEALIFENRGRMFLGLEQSLQHLKLSNTSLTSVSCSKVNIVFNVRNRFRFLDTRIAVTVSAEPGPIQKSNRVRIVGQSF